MAEIKEERTTIVDTMDKIHKDEKGNITCCGGLLQMTMHIDGTDFYESQYKCECGNCISIHTKIDEKDMMLLKEV